MESKLMRLVKHHTGTIIALIIVGIFAGIQYYLTDTVSLRGNYGVLNLLIRQGLDGGLLLLLFILVKMIVYKYQLFGIGGNHQHSGWLGGMLGLLVTGCPGCSITIAGYLGLSSFITFLPYDGIELKVIALLLVGYAVYDNRIKLDSCLFIPKK